MSIVGRLIDCAAAPGAAPPSIAAAKAIAETRTKLTPPHSTDAARIVAKHGAWARASRFVG
jgi:hypothetical protein